MIASGAGAYTPPMSCTRVAAACALALLAAAPAFAQTEADAVTPVGVATTGPGDVLPATHDRSITIPLPEDRPFAQIAVNLVRDLRRLVSVDSGVVLGFGSTLGAIAYKNDAHFTEHASAGGTDQIFTVGGVFGGGYVQVGLAVGTYALGRATRHQATAHLGSDLIRAQLLTGVLTHSIKALARRPRPNGEEVRRTGTYSFPSAHSSATWTSATVVWRHLGWKAGVPASLLAAYASASRLQQNQHFMSDVLVGAAIGAAVGRSVTMGHGDRHLMISPTPVPGGAAIMFAVASR
jgi:membrane-associated phospholipid phosphatase